MGNIFGTVFSVIFFLGGNKIYGSLASQCSSFFAFLGQRHRLFVLPYVASKCIPNTYKQPVSHRFPEPRVPVSAQTFH